MYHTKVNHTFYQFPDLKSVMAKASPVRSGDQLAGVAASTAQERVAAQMVLADIPLQAFLDHPLIAPEEDEVTRLILETHDPRAFEPLRHFTVGQLRDWLLDYSTTTEVLSAVSRGLTPEMVAAVSKIMGNQDLILVASKCRVVTKFRNTIGLPSRLSTRLQPNHPIDDPKGVAASILDGLLLGSGDAVIGINPATDSSQALDTLTNLLADLIEGYGIPTQSCVLGHITSQIAAIERGLPVDLVFQSIAGTEAANTSFGVNLSLLQEGLEAARSLGRGSAGENVMYFETGQGSCLSAAAHHGVDQQTLEARAYAVARHFDPLLVNTVVGFIGPEYLYDGKQIIRAGLEDHFCGKLLGLPMGCDICYTNHAQADQDDMDNLLVLLGAAGCNYIMGVPGADDIMLGYQSTSFHDANFLRQVLGVKPAPEFEEWLQTMGVTDSKGMVRSIDQVSQRFPLKGGSQVNVDLPLAASRDAMKKSWAQSTTARLALPRAGSSIASVERLNFQLDHANARDAVHCPFDPAAFQERLRTLNHDTLLLETAAPDRATFLQRPDLGRQLSRHSHDMLTRWKNDHQNDSFDVVLTISDGLSALAIERYGFGLCQELMKAFQREGLRVGPVCIAGNGRVALQDEIGALLEARLILTLIGERPGLGNPDSLGAYFVVNPSPSNTDANRNCVSNIHASGLSVDMAARKLSTLVSRSLKLGISGVALKDDDTSHPVSDVKSEGGTQEKRRPNLT